MWILQWLASSQQAMFIKCIHMIVIPIHSLSFLTSIPLHEQITVSSYVLPLMDIWVVSGLGLLGNFPKS